MSEWLAVYFVSFVHRGFFDTLLWDACFAFLSGCLRIEAEWSDPRSGSAKKRGSPAGCHRVSQESR